MEKFFNKLNSLIFTRIQADKHDLPWHLTVYNYPTLILFPADRKHHSIVFPSSIEPITSTRLIHFLLYHLSFNRSFDIQEYAQQKRCTANVTQSFFNEFSYLSHFISLFS